MVLAQTGTSRQAGNGDFFLRSSGKALLTKINKGIIWWISSVRKPLTDIHVTVAISDKGDVLEYPHRCLWHLLSSRGVLFYILSGRLIGNIDAFAAGSPRNAAAS
jgi:hypothetical protein